MILFECHDIGTRVNISSSGTENFIKSEGGDFACNFSECHFFTPVTSWVVTRLSSEGGRWMSDNEQPLMEAREEDN
jgi:hypothetical protein